MKKFIHFINTGFNRGINHSEEWWRYRLEIFKKFTLASLINQTNKDFYLRFSLRKNYPLVEELESVLKESEIRYVISYDDIPGDIERIVQTIPEFENVQYVYDTRIDTDDLFHKEVIDEIQKYDFDWRRALVFQKGFCYNCVENKLQHYEAFSPPNATLMHPKEIYIDIPKRTEYNAGLCSHDQVFGLFNSIIMSENKYMILVHSNNQDTIYIENATSLKRYEIPISEYERILKDFNINSQTYSTICK